MSPIFQRLGQILGVVAPIAGSLIGSPVAGVIIGKIAGLLDIPTTGDSTDLATQVVDKLETDPSCLVRLKELDNDIEIQKLALRKSQVDLNIEESRSLGAKLAWRSLLGYVVVLAVLINIVVFPILKTIGVVVPETDLKLIMSTLIGMLGLGG